MLTCRTIHSLLYRELDPDPGLYFPKVLVKHGERLGIAFGDILKRQIEDSSETLSDDAETFDDLCYLEYQRLRARMETARDTRLSGFLADRVAFIERIHNEAFERDFWDFTWLLEEGVKRGTKWTGDYAAVDEINDLNTLQATLVSRIEADLVEYVGDLDQAIYGFAGVDPQKILHTLPHDEIETMELSYRLTAPVARAAETCLARASWRSDGRIRTQREGGEYANRNLIENVFRRIKRDAEMLGEVYVIGRTNWLVSKARKLASEYGLNIARSGDEEHLREFCQLVLKPEPSLRHSLIPAITASFLEAREYYRPGAKAALKRLWDSDPNGSMDWGQFFENYGNTKLKSVIEGDWREWYHGQQFDPSKPIVRFDTFHASKGMEAPTVVVLTDMTERVEAEGIADEEIRLAYVAITRGIERVLPVEMEYGDQSRWIPGELW